jgi:chemotaxis protein methyltransferase CheR
MPISAVEFDFIRGLVEQRSAIVLEAGKEYLAEQRLSGLVRREGLSSFGDLVQKLRAQPWNGLHRQVVEAMTTNETSFFRDITPFDALRTHIVPDVMARHAERRQLRIWCGAASTGQEPYSLAMLLREHFPALATWRVEIVATDLSRDVLQKAQQGSYSQLEVNRGLPAPMLLKYFEKDGIAWRVKPVLREMITFREMNLIGSWHTVPEVDIVLLRNVLIYFDLTVKKRILANLLRVVRPGGYLLLGSAESATSIDERFQRVLVGRTTCYQPTARQEQAA